MRLNTTKLFPNRPFSVPSDVKELRKISLKVHNDKRQIHDAGRLQLSNSLSDKAQEDAEKLAIRPLKGAESSDKIFLAGSIRSSYIYCPYSADDVQKSDAEQIESITLKW